MANLRFRGDQPQLAAVADFAQELMMAGESSPLQRNLIAAIQDELTPRQQQVVLLYYGEELTLKEIGARLGVDKSTVSRTLHRGEARLGKCLKYGAGRLLRSVRVGAPAK